MSPDNTLPSTEHAKDVLQKTFSRLVTFPTPEDLQELPNAVFMERTKQLNPFLAELDSPMYGLLSVPIPGVYGDFNNDLPEILRRNGNRNILAYRSSHEGLLKIVYPSVSDMQGLGEVTSIDVYSRAHFNDLYSRGDYKRVSFLPIDNGGRHMSSKAVLRSTHHFANFDPNAETLRFRGFNVDASELSAPEEQMTEIGFRIKNEPFRLTFRPLQLKYAAESAYDVLRSSPITYYSQN